MFRQFIRKLMPVSQATMPMGRWARNDCIETKAIYASHDHCGSQICKLPEEAIKEVRKVQNKNKNKLI